MNSTENLENLIPEDFIKKLKDSGVLFSELRQGCKKPEKLAEAIYSHWRCGTIKDLIHLY